MFITAKNTEVWPDPDFDAKCIDICALYQAASAAAEHGVRTVSIDEMTGIQALERAAPSLPMQRRQVERPEFEYVRHGTKALIAACDVATGQVHGTVSDTRTEADFVSFPAELFASAPPTARWDVVCDNLNSDLCEGVTRLVADLCGIDDELGEKGKCGIRQSWRRARRSCATRHTGSRSISRRSVRRGSTRSRSGSWIPTVTSRRW